MPRPAPGIATAALTEYIGRVYDVKARGIELLSAVSDADMSGYRIDADGGPVLP